MKLEDDWRDELFELLRIPSISADAAHRDDVRAAAEWVCSFLRAAGGSAELIETARHPLAVGELRASNDAAAAPVVLLYGHVDVQPPGSTELWTSPPFEPTIRQGCIYARGAADDKGQFYALLKGAELLARRGALPVNVRVVADAEEEIAGQSVVDFLDSDEGGADACLFFDDHMPRESVPAFAIATRGIVYLHVRTRTGAQDLHSGLFGGAAVNAVHVLMRALNALAIVPDVLRVGVATPSEEELAAWQELEPGNDVLAREGATPTDDAAGDEFYLRTFASTTVDVNGVAGGEPSLLKTVLPVAAEANVSIRLAPGQDATAIADAAEAVLRGAVPRGTEIEVERWSVSEPAFLAERGSSALTLAQDAFQRVFGRRPLLVRSGGALPLGPVLARRQIPTILAGFALRGSNMHAPNERLLASQVALAIEAAGQTLIAYAELAS